MNKILLVDLSNFFGGGEKFICDIFQCGIDIYSPCEELKKRFSTIPNIKFINQLPFFKFIKFINRSEYKVVILNGGRSLFFAFFLNKNNIGIRHTLNASINQRYSLIYRGLLNFSYCFMKKIIHVSNISKQEQRFNKRNGIVILNSSTAKNVKPRHISKKLTFLYVGRIEKDKGCDILFNYFKNHTDIILKVVGSGSLPVLQCENIIYYGFQTELDKYYNSADFFITLTTRENCSLSIIDSLSYGVPVIATDVGGNPELVKDGETGFLINDINDLNKTIQKCKELSDHHYSQMSNKCIEFQIKELNIEIQRRKYMELINDYCD